ncbi:hypothetical protein L2E82_03975 [Cichorium intybus]|uniref:Uncharacterized protein n=1 Tax=Cichorium intybus TaxID=13427 RepID=A0ACB9H5T1_CICIN|nr:hypothetical protein L2E82_03975 [Cichorium intybus]
MSQDSGENANLSVKQLYCVFETELLWTSHHLRLFAAFQKANQILFCNIYIFQIPNLSSCKNIIEPLPVEFNIESERITSLSVVNYSLLACHVDEF